MGKYRDKELETFEESVDFDKVLEKDEHETRYDKVIKHRKKLKLRRKRVKILLLIILIGGISVYMFTGLSNIKVLKVKNNVVYSQAQVLKKAGLDYDEKMIFHPVFFIENALKDDPLIKDVSVHKDYLSGAIYIDVSEEFVVGYYDDKGKQFVLLANGESVELKDKSISLVSSPYIHGLNEKQRKELAKALGKNKRDDVALISEIRHYATTFDDDMLELVMGDGHHIIRSTYEGLQLLSGYRGVLEKENGKKRCIEIVEATGTMSTTNCE